MAAYRGDDLNITCDCELTTCTPGLALGPTLGSEYRRTLAVVASQKDSFIHPMLCFKLNSSLDSKGNVT